MRSSPNLICGFIAPDDARTAPEFISQRWADMVVEPISIAAPRIISFKPGHTPMMRLPPRKATVICHLPLRKAFCKSRITCRSAVISPSTRSGHWSLSASTTRRRSPDGSCISGSRTSMKQRRVGASTSITRSSAAFLIT